MLFRKYSHRLEEYLTSRPNKILLVNGARQIGKSYIIRHVGTKLALRPEYQCCFAR